MKLSACSSIVQGGGKRRMGVTMAPFPPKATVGRFRTAWSLRVKLRLGEMSASRQLYPETGHIAALRCTLGGYPDGGVNVTARRLIITALNSRFSARGFLCDQRRCRACRHWYELRTHKLSEETAALRQIRERAGLDDLAVLKD